MEENELIEEYIQEARLRCKKGEYRKALEILQRAKILPSGTESQIKKIEELSGQIEFILHRQSTNYQEVKREIDSGIKEEEIGERTGMPSTTIQVAIEIANVEGRISPEQYEERAKDQLKEAIEQCIRIGDLAEAMKLLKQAQREAITTESKREIELLYGKIYQKQIEKQEGR